MNITNRQFEKIS